MTKIYIQQSLVKFIYMDALKLGLTKIVVPLVPHEQCSTSPHRPLIACSDIELSQFYHNHCWPTVMNSHLSMVVNVNGYNYRFLVMNSHLSIPTAIWSLKFAPQTISVCQTVSWLSIVGQAPCIRWTTRQQTPDSTLTSPNVFRTNASVEKRIGNILILRLFNTT